MQRGFILGIGTNIDPERNALRILDRLVFTFGRLLVSRTYYTDPVGMISARRFINYCVFAPTELDPIRCKAACVEIEIQLGRNRADSQKKTADRTADIDLLAQIPGEALCAERIAGNDYLLQPTREIVSMIGGDVIPPRSEGRLCVLPPLGDTPATVDRDDSSGLIVIS